MAKTKLPTAPVPALTDFNSLSSLPSSEYESSQFNSIPSSLLDSQKDGDFFTLANPISSVSTGRGALPTKFAQVIGKKAAV